MTVQAVIWDLGNVLMRWDPEGYYDRTLGRDARREMFAETGIEAMNLEIDRGAPWRDSVHALADRHPAWADAIRDWHDRWLDLTGGEIAGSVRLLSALRARGVPVFALTNFGTETLALAERHYPSLADFDGRFVSGALGLVKPDPAIYAAVEDGTGIAPGALLFVDDRPENVAAAEARGWRGHVFDGPDGWARRLRDEGLLAEDDA